MTVVLPIDRTDTGGVIVSVVDSENYWHATGAAEVLTLLSSDERDAVNRFIFDEDRISYAVAHHVARTMLAEEMDCDADKLVFYREEGKKPQIWPLDESLSFSISHTRGAVAFALGRNVSVGVDVELDRGFSDLASLTRTALTPRECDRLDTVDPFQRSRAFLRLWTVKEAYTKAIGKGLSFPLTDIEVDANDLVIRSACTGIPLAGVEVRSCEAGPHHAAALVLVRTQ